MMIDYSPFVSRVERRKKWFLGLSVFGFVMFVTGIVLEMLVQADNSFMSGYQTGSGCALFVLGLMKYRQANRLSKNKDDAARKELADNDERAQFITLKSVSVASYVLYLLLYLVTCVAGYLNRTVFYILVAVLLTHLALILVSRLYYSRKY